MGEPATFPQLLLHNARTRGERPAMRHKDQGIWQSWTWAQQADAVRALAAGLAGLGLAPGERIAIIGHNRPRLYWSMVAAQSLGAVPVPLYQDAIGAEMEHVLAHSGVAMAVVQDQEQVDKLIGVQDRLPALRHIIYDEERGLRDYDHTRLHNLSALMVNATLVPGWEDRIAAGRGTDVSTVLYTSGTTGKPKGVMLTFDNLIATARAANTFDALSEREEVVAYLPMAWVGDHVFSFAQAYCAGYCVNCPESPDTAAADRNEIGPSYFFAPPRVFENLLTITSVRMEDAGPAKRWLYRTFIAHARRWGEPILNRDAVPLGARLLYGLGQALVYAPLKNQMGFGRLRVGYTAGEAIGPEMFRYFRALGLNLKQLYGQTESTVYITQQPDGEISAETVGKPAGGVELRIEPNGEVLFRGPGAFAGYLDDPASTASTKDAEGWVKTGDAGFIDARGHLRIIDRAKDVGKLADGTLFAPKYLENKLKFFPHIREAVAIGDGCAQASVMLNIDLIATGNWAEREGITYASYQELAAHPRVYALLAGHVAAVNASLAKEGGPLAGLRLHRFLVLPKELDADDGELTRTQKVRRKFIAERYASLIDALNCAAPYGDITIETVFEDGRRGTMQARVAIQDVIAPAPVLARAA